MRYAGFYLNLVILLHHGLRHNMRFSRAEALLFLGVQNLVDEKYNLEVFFVVCYENFRRQPCYSTFILGEITHRER